MAQQVRIRSIPSQYQDGFIGIRDLPSEAVLQELLSALETAPLLMSSDALSERLSEDVEGIPRKSISDITASLLSAYSLREQFDISMSEVAGHLARTMQESGVERLRFEGENQRAEFERRLVAMLNSGSLDLIGKASELTFEQGRFMREARLMTDIRPIFGTEAVIRPEGAVIVHTLKLSYWDESNEPRDFHLAIDAADIRSLRTLLDRAEAKAESLRSVLRETEVPLVDLD